MQYVSDKIDYSIGIRTKRLQDGLIKEMREEEIELEFKNIQEEQEKDDESVDEIH